MDGFYRGIETSLLVLSLVLGLGAALSSGAPTAEAQAFATLPMLTVVADR